MAFGLGILCLSHRDFWAMSFPEFNAALDGYVRSQGGGGAGTGGLTGDDVRQLQDAMMRAEEDRRG